MNQCVKQFVNLPFVIWNTSQMYGLCKHYNTEQLKNELRKCYHIWTITACVLVVYDRVCIFITLRPRQNGGHFPDNIFKCILLNENVWILLKISLKFVPQGSIKNIPALVQWSAPSHYLDQWWLNYRCIYASLGLNELYSRNKYFFIQFIPKWEHHEWWYWGHVSTMASQLTSNSTVWSTSCSD